jgi:hypothetical protein
MSTAADIRIALDLPDEASPPRTRQGDYDTRLSASSRARRRAAHADRPRG